jgi:hypothetical protein
LRRALADPRPESRVVVFAADPGDLTPRGRICHHDQSLALAEAGRRRPLGEAGDALDDVAVDAALLEPADGSALHHDIGEVHRSGS